MTQQLLSPEKTTLGVLWETCCIAHFQSNFLEHFIFILLRQLQDLKVEMKKKLLKTACLMLIIIVLKFYKLIYKF